MAGPHTPGLSLFLYTQASPSRSLRPARSRCTSTTSCMLVSKRAPTPHFPPTRTSTTRGLSNKTTLLWFVLSVWPGNAIRGGGAPSPCYDATHPKWRSVRTILITISSSHPSGNTCNLYRPNTSPFVSISCCRQARFFMTTCTSARMSVTQMRCASLPSSPPLCEPRRDNQCGQCSLSLSLSIEQTA
eukprot:SAG22_NODE_17_length_32684_cov_34.234095_10_plen_187_part_00